MLPCRWRFQPCLLDEQLNAVKSEASSGFEQGRRLWEVCLAEERCRVDASEVGSIVEVRAQWQHFKVKMWSG